MIGRGMTAPTFCAWTMFIADAADAAGKSRGDINAHMGTSDMAGFVDVTPVAFGANVQTWPQRLRLKAVHWLRREKRDVRVWRLNGRKGTPGEAWDQREITGKVSWLYPSTTSGV